MLSKAHLHMRKLLRILSKDFSIPLLEEVKNGDKRYDFYLPTKPPYVIEVDGEQHYANKPDGHFFKTEESLLKYKANDKSREMEKKSGAIKLLRFKSSEFPTLSELYEKIDFSIIKRGKNDSDVFYKKIRFMEEIADRKKEEIKRKKQDIKQGSSNGPRFVKKKTGNNCL